MAYDLRQLPTDDAELAAAIADAADDGSTGMARLVILCLWQAGQRQDPRGHYAGPSGETPLSYLHDRLLLVRHAPPGYITWSQFTEMQRWYPEPEMIGTPWHYIESILKLGEYGELHQQIVQVSITRWAGLYPRIRLALLLAKHGLKWEALQQLESVLAQRPRWGIDEPNPQVSAALQDIAAIYAYLGEMNPARNLLKTADPETHLFVECVALLFQQRNHAPADPTRVLMLLTDAEGGSPAKHRAAIHTGVLRLLLDLGLVNAGMQSLPTLFQTLHKIPLWGKFEWRTQDVATALLPYAKTHADQIYPLARDLLISKSQPSQVNAPGDFWWSIHAVSALAWLLYQWSTQENYQEIIDFLSTWKADTGPAAA
jgi:hypothetical protein